MQLNTNGREKKEKGSRRRYVLFLECVANTSGACASKQLSALSRLGRAHFQTYAL